MPQSVNRNTARDAHLMKATLAPLDGLSLKSSVQIPRTRRARESMLLASRGFEERQLGRWPRR